MWFRDLRPDKPAFLDDPLAGTPEEIATAMQSYAARGVRHIMFQCEPQTAESLRQLTKAVQLYRLSASGDCAEVADRASE